MEKAIRDQGKSLEHRETILKAHYEMQHLKSTISKIRSNRYANNPTTLSTDVGQTKSSLVLPEIRISLDVMFLI